MPKLDTEPRSSQSETTGLTTKNPLGSLAAYSREEHCKDADLFHGQIYMVARHVIGLQSGIYLVETPHKA